ncbi:ATP-binding protein [Aquitalea palustris]|uniref:ATP-binding protein n=1 Tax=Aquitalea palustris TaxID=2480983 RepID=UPI001CEFB4A2|nr:ATP-binding protein [Aquitalea palustris]
MLQSLPTSPAERRGFAVHPSIIKTLIHEQAGSVAKAMAELIMNAVDAGASRIDLQVEEDGRFVLRDDGRGFGSRDDIEQFFETFGTPHQDDDAHYGQFRIGRGQIMSYARTCWRSGHWEMRVDLENDANSFGYDLVEHAQAHAGCEISGTFYETRYLEHQLLSMDSWSDMSLQSQVLFVPVPIWVNGRQINRLPSEEQWDAEDDVAYYRFNRDRFASLNVYNRGVLVERIRGERYGVGGVVVSKEQLAVNLARNAVRQHHCATWQRIEMAIQQRFALQLSRAKKLTDAAAVKLMQDLVGEDCRVNYQLSQQIREVRFLPDVHGELQTPSKLLAGNRFTLFDGQHMGIAERVQREGLATVITPAMLALARQEATDENAVLLLKRLRERLHLGGAATFIPFRRFVRDLNDTVALLPEQELSAEEQLVLQCLRYVNKRVAYCCFRKWGQDRQIKVGKADHLLAWTDGCSYIVFERDTLSALRTHGTGWLVQILAHEYAHQERSVGEHEHDFDFYRRYHDATLHPDFALVGDMLFRRYITGMAKLGRIPSREHGRHLRALVRQAGSLKTRRLAYPNLLIAAAESIS